MYNHAATWQFSNTFININIAIDLRQGRTIPNVRLFCSQAWATLQTLTRQSNTQPDVPMHVPTKSLFCLHLFTNLSAE